MNLIHLRYFVELAHTRHYTRAAENLCITQPSLSHAIAQLEAEVQVPLFEKTGRNTELTCYGEQFLSCVESALKTLDDGLDALQSGARGEGVIRLGMVRPVGVQFIPELAEQFLKANPDKDIRFTFSTDVSQNLMEGLHAHHFDLVFCSRPKSDVGISAVVVSHQEMVLVVPKEHPLACYDEIDLNDTLSYPYIYFCENSGLHYEVDKLFELIGKRPRIAYEVLEDQVAAGLVARNFGIALIPEIEILSTLDVKVIKIRKPVWERNIYMVSNNRVFMPKVVQDFRNFVMRKCGI